MTVTGTTRPRASKTWVMPSFSPSSPRTLVMVCLPPRLELDLDVDARRKVESHERVHRLRGRVEDVDEALVRAHLEVLGRVLVLVRRPDPAEHFLLGRQRPRPRHVRTRARHRVD